MTRLGIKVFPPQAQEKNQEEFKLISEPATVTCALDTGSEGKLGKQASSGNFKLKNTGFSDIKIINEELVFTYESSSCITDKYKCRTLKSSGNNEIDVWLGNSPIDMTKMNPGQNYDIIKSGATYGNTFIQCNIGLSKSSSKTAEYHGVYKIYYEKGSFNIPFSIKVSGQEEVKQTSSVDCGVAREISYESTTGPDGYSRPEYIADENTKAAWACFADYIEKCTLATIKSEVQGIAMEYQIIKKQGDVCQVSGPKFTSTGLTNVTCDITKEWIDFAFIEMGEKNAPGEKFVKGLSVVSIITAGGKIEYPDKTFTAECE